MFVAFAVAALSAGPFAPQQPAPDPLPAALARAVDLPTSAERRAAVADLLARSTDVDAWRARCAAFGAFEPLEPGPSRQTVDLQVLDQVEPTEVHLYVPKGYDPARPAPLLLWSHGQGGSGAREYERWQAVADAVGMLVLAPTEPGAVRGFTKEPRERAAALAALRWARRRANVDENAIFVGGWSRGGHLTWDLALRHPDRWAGALPVVGGPLIEPGPTNNLRYLENVVPLPIRDLQGSQDDPVLLTHLHLAFARLKKWRAPDAELIEFADRGHDADLGAVDWQAFFAKRRDARPRRIVRTAADPEAARAAWVEVTKVAAKVAVAAQPLAPANWARLTDEQRRAYLLDAFDDYTARLEVEDKGSGRFVASGKGVAAFALWLDAAQLGKDGKVEVRFGARTSKATVAASAEVLLTDFVERFDRTRLAVARVEVR